MNDHNTILGRNEPIEAQEPLFFKLSDSDADKDRKIWNAFRAGSRDALDFIFRQHASNLFVYGTRFTKDQELVLDCIQDLFVELWNRRQRLSETNSIKFYLLAALRRRVARSLNGVKRFEAISGDIIQMEEKINFSTEHLLVLQETEQFRKANLKRAIEALTKRQRECIYLKFFQGLDNEAISSVMGLTLGSVNTLVSQAIRSLRASVA